MKRTLFILAALVSIHFALSSASAQSEIKRPCPVVGGLQKAKVVINASGQVTLQPCPTKTIRFDNPLGTSPWPFVYNPAGTLTIGNATNAYLSMGSGSGGTTYLKGIGGVTIDSNAATFGDYSEAGGGAKITLGGDSGQGSLYLLGGTNNNTSISVDDGASEVRISSGTILRLGANSPLLFGAGSELLADRTITPINTTGNQTINKMAGTVNIAPGLAALFVTNSHVSPTSIVFTTVRTDDATCTSVHSAVPSSGYVLITMNANCTAATSIGFLVTN